MVAVIALAAWRLLPSGRGGNAAPSFTESYMLA
jgi:hypothetical protein